MPLKRLCCLLPLLWLTACVPSPRIKPAPALKPTAARPAGAPSAKPFLRLETGGHTAKLWRIAVDVAERFLVSASDDKTARVWDLASGKLLQTLRPPLGEGDEGKLYAVAISPDGATVAAAGWTGWDWYGTHNIHLFDRASGQLRRRLTGLPNVIFDLAYSPDGRYLAAALGAGAGIRVFRPADGTEAFRGDCGAGSYSVEFDRRGRLLTACLDGRLRLYDASFKLLAEQAAPGGKQPYFARFSPDGTQIAVGFADSTAVNLLSGEDLHFLYAPDTQGVDNGQLGEVAWSADGRHLYAAGRYHDGSNWLPVLRWDLANRGKPQAFRMSADTVMDLRPLRDGRLAFGAADPVVGLLQADGGKVWERRGEKLDFRYDESRLRLSADGSVVEFGFDILKDGAWQRGLARFDLVGKTLSLDTQHLPSLNAPDTPGIFSFQSNWRDTLSPTVHGTRLTLETYEHSWSLALATQGQGFLLGTEWRLRYYDDPQHLRWQAAIPGTAWAVNLSTDGRYAVAAFADGTIRWYQTKDGKEVLALYVHPDGQRWVAWTPEGFYDAAPGADSLIGYHLNQGPDKAGKFIDTGRLAETFYRPSLIAQRLSPEGDKLMAAAVRELGQVDEVLKTQAPTVELLAVRPTDKPGEYALQVRVDYGNGNPGEVSVSVNDAPPTRSAGRRPGSPGGFDTLLYKLPAGRATVRLSATNSLGTASAPDDPAAEKTVVVPAYDDPPNLFMLAVGIHDYRDKSLNKGVFYADRDAKDVAGRFREQGGKLYQHVDVRELYDGQATGTAIQAAMADIAQKADGNDVFVLYLAGHGFAVRDAFHFVPWDDVKTSEEDFRKQSLDETTLVSLLTHIKARKSLVLLDSCASGTFNWAAGRGRDGDEKDAVSRWAKLSGRAIIAATDSEANPARETSRGEEQGHGYFTYALLEGLKGAADRGKVNGTIEVDELADYIQERLPQISAQGGVEQFPWKDTQGASFTVLPKP